MAIRRLTEMTSHCIFVCRFTDADETTRSSLGPIGFDGTHKQHIRQKTKGKNKTKMLHGQWTLDTYCTSTLPPSRLAKHPGPREAGKRTGP